MKNALKRKEIQTKLNSCITDFAGTYIKSDSKKIQKTIKKASKLIAKAIVKNSDSSKVEISLLEKVHAPITTPKARKRVRTTVAKVKTVSRRGRPKKGVQAKIAAKINGITENIALPKAEKKEAVKG